MMHRAGFSKRILLALLLVLLLPQSSHAQNNTPIIIRDTEIENIFAQWMAPILKQAKLGKDSTKIILVQSDQINAFVASGSNIFFYTGLIKKTDSPSEILGVMAHETGHIAGGHLVKTRAALRRASYESILGMVVGIGAAIVTGHGEAASAIMGGSQSMAQRRFLAHSRINEASADQAAYAYLNGAEINASGLSSFFKKLQAQELLPTSRQSEYMRSHPVTHSRVEAINALIDQNPALKNKALPAKWIKQHALMKAKLMGFIHPEQVEWHYDDKDHTIPARYARAIAAYRKNEIKSALKQINTLIHDQPQNPYFHELKGQMLFEFSRVKDSIPAYRKALSIMPEAPLIRIALAHALIENNGGKASLKEAVTHLKRALNKEEYSAHSHRLLATAYGRLGEESQAKLHLAEEAILQRRLPYAKAQATRILNTATPKSKTWLKAQNILTHIKNLEKQSGV